jgi:hypothetical protein
MRLFLAALLSAVSVTIGLDAQDKPNLSGKWVFDHDETAPEVKATATTRIAANQRFVPETLWKNGNQGPDFTFTHEGKTLKFERSLPDGRVSTTTYVLDGSETPHRKADLNGQPGAPWTSRSSWQDSTLQILSVEEGGGIRMGGPRGAGPETFAIKIERKQVFSLSPDGNLISEMSFRGSSGEWGPIARSIYKKG